MERVNPRVNFIFFVLVSGITMFSLNPVILCMSLVFSFLICATVGMQLNEKRMRLWPFVPGIIVILVNPVFSHNGSTVLLFIGDNPLTLESVIYGVVSATMLVSVLYFFICLSYSMSDDKFMYVCGFLSPKLSLMLSMVFRLIPLMGRKMKEADEAARCMGMYKSENIFSDIKVKLHVFSVITTWSLEHGITTADSMDARGYGRRRQSFYSVFKFTLRDKIYLLLILVLGIYVIFGIAIHKLNVSYYPDIVIAKPDVYTLSLYVSFLVLLISGVLLNKKAR